MPPGRARPRRRHHRTRGIARLALLALCAPTAIAQEAAKPAEGEKDSKFFSDEDDWFDISEFLDEKYGFLPVVIPITEPAVGYGAGVGALFLSRPLGDAKAGLGRPNITAVAGFGTENGTKGAAVGDMRYWLDDHLQTVAGLISASVNLDFHGVGDDPLLDDDPLGYNLEPQGGLVQAKYRFGDSSVWAGLGYSFASTRVSFDDPTGTGGIPDFTSDSDVAGFSPSLTFDTRDNIFTPKRGTYVEASAGLYAKALGGDDDFQRLRLIAMQFIALSETLDLGLRGEGAASFGDAPFYMRPFINLRGAPVMRYQGEETAQIEGELVWQFWQRFSAVGFVGLGSAWNDFDDIDDRQTITTGGTGFRYELARAYGIHAGLDVAVGPENVAVYIQVGSAWARP